MRRGRVAARQCRASLRVRACAQRAEASITERGVEDLAREGRDVIRDRRASEEDSAFVAEIVAVVVKQVVGIH